MITYKELQEKGICWTGYKRKKGTKPYEEGSCVKEELEQHHALAFGRMNPITSGHEAVVNKLHSVAKEHNATHSLVVSHSQDAKKNPLSAEQKVKHAKHAFPGTNVTAASKEAPTILHHAAAAHAAGATHLHVVAGSDRHEEMHNLLHKYNGQKAAHGHYNFKKITVHSSGERDPDAEGTTGISASKMREHAASGNKKAFHAGAPSKMKPEHKDAMYNDVRKGMNLKEETMDQQADRAAQLKRFKEQMSQSNGPQIDTEIALDKKEKDIMTGKKKPDNKTELGLNKDAKNNLADVNEHLTAAAGAGAWINDFISSTNPRFNNKSKSERRKMAIGAYMAAKAKGMKEEVELEEAKHYPYKFRATYHDPDTDKMTHVMDFTHRNLEAAKKHAQSSRLQRRDGKEDKLHSVVQMKEEVEIEEGYDKTSAMHKAAKQAAQGFDGKAIYHPNGHAEVRMRAMVHGHSTVNPHGTVLMSGEDKAKRAAKEHGGKAEGSIVHFKEGTLQGNVAGGDAMNTTTSAPSDNKMPAGSVKKVKGFKFFNGTNEPNTQMAVKEEKKDDVPFDGPYTSTFKKPNNPNRTGMDSARSLAQRAMDQLNKKKPVKEEAEEIEERNKQNALMRKTMDASRGAKFKLNNPVPDADPKHKTARDHNVAIGRALRNEAATGNPGGGYHGACGTPDDMYDDMHKHVKNLTDGDDKTVKHYLDSGHGEKLAGREQDHDHIKADFKKFMKYYRPEMHDSKPAVKEETAPVGKPQKIDKKTAVIKLHPNGAASDTDEGWAKPKIKEGTMKSYKDFLQGLDEASKKKPSWLLDAELNAEKKEGKLKEEAEVLDELHPLTYMSYHNKATAIGRDGEKAFDKSGKDRSTNIAKADKRVIDSAHGKGPLAKLYPSGKKSTLGKKAQAAVRSNAQWNEETEELEELEEKNWIAGAIKHPGAMTAAAKRAGETNAEYEQEHKHDSGKAGRRARLALTLKKMHEEQIDEIKLADLPSRKIQGRSYGADYHDPEGADDAWEKEKTPKAGKAGRKAGSGAGVYKPRKTMSKLKQLGATYK